MSIQQEKLKAIADKIREKTGETNPIKPNDFVNKIDDVYNAGKKLSYAPMEYEMKKSTISISNAMPNMSLLNYQIWGNSIQETQPTRDNPRELICVGDLVTDSADEHYGKYKIPYTFNGTEYAVYLSEPLRGITSYGYFSDTATMRYNYCMDYIDFKTQKVIRNVKELIPDISSISVMSGVGNTCWIVNGAVYVRSVKGYPDMATKFPISHTIEGGILSNYLQRQIKRNNVDTNTSHYAMGVNSYNNIYYYWNLSELGLTTEESDETDFLLKTSEPKYYKVKVSDGTYLTDASQIGEKIVEYYSGITIKIYYPLKESTYEDIVLEELTAPETGEMTLNVNTEQAPHKIHLEYYADKYYIGKIDEWNTFWDAFQENGNKTSYDFAFYGSHWNETTLKPKYDIVPINASSMFRSYQGIKENISDYFEKLGIKLDFSKCTNFTDTFAQPGVIGVGTIDTRNYSTIGTMFNGNNLLEEIRELILKDDGSQTIHGNCFAGTSKLKTINIAGRIGVNVSFPSPVLTRESITSIINALSLTATGKTLTLKTDAVNSAFETSEGAKDGKTSQEWLALTGTKTHWTITLS